MKFLFNKILVPIIVIILLFFTTWCVCNIIIPYIQSGQHFLDTIKWFIETWWSGLKSLIGG